MQYKMRIDGITFSPSSLDERPAEAALLGQIVTTFSLIEGLVGGIYGMLRHQDIGEALDELKDLPTNARRVQAVRNELAKNPLTAKDSQHDDLLKSVLNYAVRRNKIAHGLWGTNPDNQDHVYRIPVKKWINWLAALISSGTDGTFVEKVDMLKAEIETYDIQIIKQLKIDGEALLIEVGNLFNQLAAVNAEADGWQKVPPGS